jgi:hypothetical protein
MFERRVRKRIFGPKREKVTGSWRNINNEELRNLCSSPNITMVIKSRKVRLAGYIARMR